VSIGKVYGLGHFWKINSRPVKDGNTIKRKVKGFASNRCSRLCAGLADDSY